MNKIPRYDIDDSDPLSNGGGQMELHPLGDYVEYEDHLRAVTLAKIEVLEEENGEADTAKWRQAKIAALRKELEG